MDQRANAQANANKIANASSQCTECSSAATSIQVVLARPGAHMAVNNRALAVNASCTGCHTTALAVQYVVAGGRSGRGTGSPGALLGSILSALPPPSAAGGPAGRITPQALPGPDNSVGGMSGPVDILRHQLGQAFPGSTVSVAIDAQTG